MKRHCVLNSRTRRCGSKRAQRPNQLKKREIEDLKRLDA
jgi:hypothetical protein